jgi:hypothetical protein
MVVVLVYKHSVKHTPTFRLRLTLTMFALFEAGNQVIHHHYHPTFRLRLTWG